jgi:hypothetical protein
MHRIAIINSARARALAVSAKVCLYSRLFSLTIDCWLIPVLHEILFQSTKPLVARSYATAKPGRFASYNA